MRQMLQPALNILYVIARSPERSEGRRGNLRGWQWEQGADCFPRQVGVAMTEKDSDAAISNAPSRHCEESRAKRRTTRQSQGGWQWEQEADCFTRLRRFRNDSNRLRRGNPKRHTTLPSLRGCPSEAKGDAAISNAIPPSRHCESAMADASGGFLAMTLNAGGQPFNGTIQAAVCLTIIIPDIIVAPVRRNL